ncbi:hypothetical protein SNE40_007695 [Patella caerulea]|uniref:C2H2-type domain-containing protein n=1 Tax=Patella caerulea TaxID=87958 RepID=A0AAN8JYF1_PATCE
MPGYSDNRIDSQKLADYLTCGQCAQEFPLKNITNFIQHKTDNCEKNSNQPSNGRQSTKNDNTSNEDESSNLSCSSCHQSFVTARGLLHHVQFSHNLNIFISRDEVTDTGLHDSNNDNIMIEKESLNEDDEEDDNMCTNDSSQGEVCEPSCCEGRLTSMTDRKRSCQANRYRAGSSQQMTRCSKMSASRGTTICCNSQECCVTIIPGTHEEPRKCCNSIVPKKRKLHMVKHMDQGEDSNKSNPDEDETSYDNKSSMIYIDVGSREGQFHNTSSRERTQTYSPDTSPSGTKVQISDDDNEDSNPSDDDNSTDGRRSVIIETGKSFSIPITVTSGQIVETSSLNSHTIRVYKPLNLSCNTGNRGNSDVSNMQHNSTANLQPSTSQQSSGIPASSTFVPVGDSESVWMSSTGDIGQDEEDDGEKDNAKKRRYPTSRPYKCEKCDEAFNQRIHLKKHMSKHTGVKPFKCEQCDYSTVERSHLKVHIRIHTGEKPFKCTHCEYATAQNSTLKIHLKRRHGGKMFQCDACSKMFTQESMLNNHQVEHQRDQNLSHLPLPSSDLDLLDVSSNVVPASSNSSSTIPAISNILIPPIVNQDLPTLPINQILSLQQSFTSVNTNQTITNTNQTLANSISLPSLNLTKSS